MALTISFPFRLTLSGAVASTEQGSDAANGEGIALTILTRTGERPVVPGFGTPDPAFVDFSPRLLSAGLAMYGPHVTLDSITTTIHDEGLYNAWTSTLSDAQSRFASTIDLTPYDPSVTDLVAQVQLDVELKLPEWAPTLYDPAPSRCSGLRDQPTFRCRP